MEYYPLPHAFLLLQHRKKHDSIADLDMIPYYLDVSGLRPASFRYIAGQKLVIEGMSGRSAEMFC